MIGAVMAMMLAGPIRPIAVNKLIQQERVLDEACRGDPDGIENGKCARRDRAVKKLEAIGWCLGPDDAPSDADRHWMRCGRNATAGS